MINSRSAAKILLLVVLFLIISAIIGYALYYWRCNFIERPANDTVIDNYYLKSGQQQTAINAERWHPSVGLAWQWQLDGEVDTSIDVDVYDIDLYVDQTIIDDLKASGRKVICYISVGSWEDWRPDADQFPGEVIGNKYQGWPGEKWLDIRRIDLLAPVLRERLDMCAAKGFDGVEPDNLDAFSNNTGFDISIADEIDFASWLAEEAHARGLAIGLKNAPEMAANLEPLFDFAITEDAFYEGWIGEMQMFVENNKPVFAAEYIDTNVDFDTACEWGKQYGASFILKKRNLQAFRTSCGVQGENP